MRENARRAHDFKGSETIASRLSRGLDSGRFRSRRVPEFPKRDAAASGMAERTRAVLLGVEEKAQDAGVAAVLDRDVPEF